MATLYRYIDLDWIILIYKTSLLKMQVAQVLNSYHVTQPYKLFMVKCLFLIGVQSVLIRGWFIQMAQLVLNLDLVYSQVYQPIRR